MSERADLRERLALLVVSDPDCGEGRELAEVVRAALQAGAPAVQLRAKQASTREMLDLARRLREETRSTGALLFVNDRVDVALVAEADGAHLGADDLPVEVARRMVPAGFLLGRSVDTPEEAMAATRAGADYVGVGPVYATPSKADTAPAVGLDGVAAVRTVTTVPVVAIGGIDAANAADVITAGAHGIAVIRAVMQADDPGRAVRDLLDAVRLGLLSRGFDY